MVLLIVVDFVVVGVIIVSVGVGVEQVVAVCAVSIGGPDEPAVSEVVILECCELGRIGVIAHVVLFDGHAPPRLIGVFSTAEGQELDLGGIDVEYFGLFAGGKLFATGWVGGLRSCFFGLFLVGDRRLITHKVGCRTIHKSIGEDFAESGRDEQSFLVRQLDGFKRTFQGCFDGSEAAETLIDLIVGFLAISFGSDGQGSPEGTGTVG